MRKRLILIIFLVLLAGVGTLVYWGQRKQGLAELYYSGTIENTQSDLAFQVSGRVQKVLVDEGQAVKKGQVLAMLAQEEFIARRNRSRADLRRAQENLRQLETMLDLERSGLPAEVERAAAAVKALKSQLEELEAGYRPQEVARAQLAFKAARATMQEARRNRDRFDKLFKKGVVSAKEKEAVDLKFETALQEYGRARETYALMKEGARKEAIATARSRLAEGRAALKRARSNLKKIKATARQVAAAEAQVQAVRAAARLARIHLQYTVLKSPFDGILISRNVEPGEIVSPGREVLTVSDLSEVDLNVFVDETEIGKIKPGSKVEVKIDTFPDKTYVGRVAYISPEAEFTPKIIQTHKERVKLVYRVKITIANPNLELKSGMPADAWFR